MPRPLHLYTGQQVQAARLSSETKDPGNQQLVTGDAHTFIYAMPTSLSTLDSRADGGHLGASVSWQPCRATSSAVFVPVQKWNVLEGWDWTGQVTTRTSLYGRQGVVTTLGLA